MRSPTCHFYSLFEKKIDNQCKSNLLLLFGSAATCLWANFLVQRAKRVLTKPIANGREGALRIFLWIKAITNQLKYRNAWSAIQFTLRRFFAPLVGFLREGESARDLLCAGLPINDTHVLFSATSEE